MVMPVKYECDSNNLTGICLSRSKLMSQIKIKELTLSNGGGGGGGGGLFIKTISAHVI